MDDNKDSGEGQKAPNREGMRPRRIRKLTGLERIAIGDLAFLLYDSIDSSMRLDARKLHAHLVAWRARYL